MPKTYTSDTDRALARFRRWYWNEKRSRDVTDEKLAKLLGVSQPAVSLKMKVNGGNQRYITLKDALLILDAMGASDEEILQLMRLRR